MINRKLDSRNNKKKETVSVVLPTFREKYSIRDCVLRFLSNGNIEEIVVVDNNSEDGTIDQIIDLPIRIIKETEQGYGAALKTGIRESSCSLIVLCEPDGTFFPEDVDKLLLYMDRCDAVFGSRTISSHILDGANMGLFLKWGNWFVAKIVEGLFLSPHLSDVGCTFRVFRKNIFKDSELRKFSNGGVFGIQLLLLAVRKKIRIAQIPVTYGPRIGISGYTGKKRTALLLGIRMIFIVITERFLSRND